MGINIGHFHGLWIWLKNEMYSQENRALFLQMLTMLLRLDDMIQLTSFLTMT